MPFAPSSPPARRRPSRRDWRERELARLDELLQAGGSGRSGALVIRGEPGIGKSALLDYARRSAGGVVLLPARGVESEAE